MTTDAAKVLHPGEVFLHAARDVLNLRVLRQAHHRIPVSGRIYLCRCLGIGRDAGSKIDDGAR